MHNKEFDELSSIIKNRRSIGWAKMNGQIIEKETIEELLDLATWAPNHGKTEPWRFYVYAGEALTQFGRDHAGLYWNNTPEDKRQQTTFEKLEHNVDKVSHLVIPVMKRGANEKIPKLEEICAASAAVQNLLLGATSLGIASFWSSGGMTHTEALKSHLELDTDDLVLGLIFLGYTDEPAKEGARGKTAADVAIWK